MTATANAAKATEPNTDNSLTAAQAAKRVKRTVVTVEDGKQKTKEVVVAADEVMAFKDYGTHVVVVTKDGQKFTDAAE